MAIMQKKSNHTSYLKYNGFYLTDDYLDLVWGVLWYFTLVKIWNVYFIFLQRALSLAGGIESFSNLLNLFLFRQGEGGGGVAREARLSGLE